MKNYPFIFKILITVFTSSVFALAVVIYVIDNTRTCLYQFGGKTLSNSGKVIASFIYGVEILVFIVRSVVIFMKIRSFQVKSDQDLRKKSQYKKLFFWVCLITVGYLFAFSTSISSIPDSSGTPKKLILIFFFLFFGFALSSFGLIFILKPHNPKKGRSSSFNATKDTNKLSTFAEN